MTVRNLEYLFRPESVAVIGATTRSPSVGLAVMRNLLQGGFQGPIMPVNPNRTAVCGVLAYPDVASLPVTPDLAVICTPVETVPGLIAELGRRGTRAAIVLTAGLARASLADGRTVQQAMLDEARPHLLRILGPNALGLLVPAAGLNASFAHVDALPGRVALIHQSGALCTALLDWARTSGIGFSHFVSIGDSADIDFGDVLDYLGGESSARAILLYIESIGDARKFMSAARAAARNKPVVVVKAGRVEEGARAAFSHTGALAGADEVYDAAFRRAGMLRVFETAEMFEAVETLAAIRKVRGDRLLILTNGGGPGVMATDALVLGGGRLAELSPQTLEKLDALLPANWSRGNPVDIIGDADGERYASALRIVYADPGVDAVLVLHAPTAVVDSVATAHAVLAERSRAGDRAPVLLTSWLGGETVEPARRLFTDASVATYSTPDGAVRAFLHIVRYQRNQAQLLETPASQPSEFEPQPETARASIARAIADGREMLSEVEAKEVLAAYGVPVVETRIAHDPAEAAKLATELGYPVALKIVSPDIVHKSDVGGVVLDLEDADAVRAAAVAMGERVRAHRGGARVKGFTVQRMARRDGAHELIIGAATDSVFGPVILFGQGGTGVEVIADRAVGLPPLNMRLAGELIERTRVSRLLGGYRDRPAVDLQALRLALMRFAQIVVDLPEVREIDVNPLFADEHGVIAVDARMRIAPAGAGAAPRLAIRPYPRELEESVDLAGLRLLLRPIRPEDEPQHAAFITRLDPQDLRMRFFGMLRDLPHTELARFTQIDYDREMAFIATTTDADGAPRTVGVARAITDPDNESAEFAIIIDSALKGKGLGRQLMEKLIAYQRGRGTRQLVGQILADNRRMLSLARWLGFELERLSDRGVVESVLKLQSPSAGAQRTPS
jgi:acetyltransferase